jgi:indolepyruvate ferredoxin oxidoreductase
MDPDAVAEAIGAKPTADESLPDLIVRLKRELTLYQNGALAERFAALVARAAEVEAARAPGRTGFAAAVARGYFKLLAYKDEYETARLLTSGTFAGDLAATFAAARVRYHLALPWRDRKIEVGRWARPLLHVLATFKILRGTPLDPFRNRAVRRLERTLIAEYEQDIAIALAALSPATHAAAIQLAVLPDSIRGFGIVKERAAAAARTRRKDLLAAVAAADGGAARAAE